MRKWKRILAATLFLMSFNVITAHATAAADQQGQTPQVVGSTAKTEAGVMKTSQVDAFQYWLHTPKNATENMPMIVCLTAGDGFSSIKTEKYFSGLCNLEKKGTDAYILAPYLPDELNSGKGGMWPVIEPSVVELINAVAAEYKIDTNRITITGVSRNADGAIQIASKYPDLFAGMALVVPFHYKCPIAKWEDSWGENLKTVQTWIFVEDEGDAKRKAESAVRTITEAGGQAWMEVRTGQDHGKATKSVCADIALGRTNVYEWLLTLSRPSSEV